MLQLFIFLVLTLIVLSVGVSAIPELLIAYLLYTYTPLQPLGIVIIETLPYVVRHSGREV